MHKTLRIQWLVLALLALAACGRVEPPHAAPQADDGMVPLQVSVLNYTDDYVNEVSVNGSWAGSMVAHSGGGSFAGSAEVPRQWDPHYTLTVRWRDGKSYDKDPEFFYERQVATEPYQQREPGGITMLWVAFFPGDVIKLYPTRVDPGHPEFPGGLLAPSWDCEKKFPGDSKCFAPEPPSKKQNNQVTENQKP